MPRMVAGIKFEHGHRMIAGTVGILTIILALWIWRQDTRRWVRWVGLAAVMAVLAQALLGGITVLFYLPVAISTAHATLGVTPFCLAVAPEGYGEIIGGSQRVSSYELLSARIDQHKLPRAAFEWYLDLRRYGSVPHSGFGMGIERLVAWVCALDHVRETIPFPRMLNRMYP